MMQLCCTILQYTILHYTIQWYLVLVQLGGLLHPQLLDVQV
jgi:hypothetical protein